MNLICLNCGEDAVSVAVNTDTVSCSQCETEWTIAEIEQAMATWAAWLPWLKSSPNATAEA